MKTDYKKIKLRYSVLSVALLVLGSSSIAMSQSFIEEEPQQCIDHSATYDRLLFSSIAGVPKDYVSDEKLYTSIVSSKDVLIDIRQDRFDRAPISTRVNGALQIPLNRLKTKAYLKTENIVLIGDGLDGYFLETEIKQLKQRGFKSIKILDNGILSLIDDERFLGAPSSRYELRLADADRLVGAAIAQRKSGNFLFVNIGKKHQVFKELDLDTLHVPYNSYQIFYESLKQSVEKRLKENEDLRVVMVHDDPAVYEQIFNAKAISKWSKLWFLKDGNSSLLDLRNNIAATAIARKRVTYVCQS